MEKIKFKDLSYVDKMHAYGKALGLTNAFAITLFPVIIMLIYNTAPNWNGVLKGTLAVAPIFWTVGIIEIFTYAPMFGVGGTYLAFLTDNLANLKVPCVLNALESANTKIDTPEGEVLATISVAISSIVTTLIISVGVLLIFIIKPFSDFLTSEALRPAFNNILPALFGGLGVVYVSRNFKIAIAPIILMLIIFICVPGMSSLVSIMVPVGAVFTICFSRFLYKKGLLKNKSKKNSEVEKIEDDIIKEVEE